MVWYMICTKIISLPPVKWAARECKRANERGGERMETLETDLKPIKEAQLTNQIFNFTCAMNELYCSVNALYSSLLPFSYERINIFLFAFLSPHIFHLLFDILALFSPFACEGIVSNDLHFLTNGGIRFVDWIEWWNVKRKQ